tara:strand:+ start:393 stop:896 length:504 start_codon:yes stop_codon:yes gene_type:complete
VTEEILRKYLEINSIKELKKVDGIPSNCSIELVDPKDFQLNKFFYKSVGKKCQWTDRLIWSNDKWANYVNNNKVSTYVLKVKNEMGGYFELVFHQDSNEVEIAYFGILEEYFGKKLGGYLLSEAIKISFAHGCLRVWVHTCSLDHKNALQNYLSRGMKIFKSEKIIR